MPQRRICIFIVCLFVLSYSWGVVASSSGNVSREHRRDDTTLQEKLTERIKTLRLIVELERISFQTGNSSLESIADVERELLDAELERAPMVEDQIALRKAAIKVASDREKRIQERVKAGDATSVAAHKAKAIRLRLEIELQRKSKK